MYNYVDFKNLEIKGLCFKFCQMAGAPNIQLGEASVHAPPI